MDDSVEIQGQVTNEIKIEENMLWGGSPGNGERMILRTYRPEEAKHVSRCRVIGSIGIKKPTK